MDRIGANPFGERRRPGDVDEEKESLLGTGSVIAPDSDIAKRAVANQPGYLQHQDTHADDQEGDRHLLHRGPIENVARHRRVEGQDRGNQGGGQPPAKSASNHAYDDHAVDKELQHETEKERRPIEGVPEAGRKPTPPALPNTAPITALMPSVVRKRLSRRRAGSLIAVSSGRGQDPRPQ